MKMRKLLATVSAVAVMVLGAPSPPAMANEGSVNVTLNFRTGTGGDILAVHYAKDHDGGTGWDSGDRTGYRCAQVILTDTDTTPTGNGGAGPLNDGTQDDGSDSRDSMGNDDDGTAVAGAFFRQIQHSEIEVEDGPDPGPDPDVPPYYIVMNDAGLEDGTRDLDGRDSNPAGGGGAQYHNVNWCYDDGTFEGPNPVDTAHAQVEPESTDYPDWYTDMDEGANCITPLVTIESENGNWDDEERDYTNEAEVELDTDRGAVACLVAVDGEDMAEVVIYADTWTMNGGGEGSEHEEDPIQAMGVVYYYSLNDDAEIYSNFDQTAPVSTIECDAGACSGVHASPVEVSLDATDDLYGVEELLYSTDGGDPDTVYEGPFELTSTATVKFAASDEATPSNVETTQSQVVTIDSTAPVTNIECDAAACEGPYEDEVEVSFDSSDSPAGVDATYYTTDGSTPTTSSTEYTAPFSLTETKTVKWFSTDLVGNAETVQSLEIEVEAGCTPTQHDTSVIAASGASSQGTGVAWSTTSNVTSSNNSWATAALNAGATTTAELLITFSGLSVPAGATIDGVTVQLEKGIGGIGSSAATDQTIKLAVSGTAVGTNKAASSWPGGGDTTVTYGGTGDGWGASLTQADIANLGVIVQAVRTGGQPTARVDYATITVRYTTCD